VPDPNWNMMSPPRGIHHGGTEDTEEDLVSY
jgi:hypothetical protein